MRQISRALDDEHRASLDLLGRVERALARSAGAARTAELAALAPGLRRFVESEIARHFAFEETELFPRLADYGEGDIAELLKEEHEAIRAVAAEITPLVQAAEQGTLESEGFDALKVLTLEMVERQVAHIQKESMALLPLLDDLLDDETDRALGMAYAAA